MAYTSKSWAETMRDLQHTFDLWGVITWAVEPRTNLRKIHQSQGEATVTVLWVVRGQELALTLGQHDTAAENLRAIYNSVEDARKIEGRGAAELMRQIFKQLPGPSGALLAPPPAAVTVDPYSVLGLQSSAPLTVIDETPTFSGWIVLKASTKAEVAVLAAQLDGYAAFDDPFANTYAAGWAAKGQVYSGATRHATDADALAIQVRDQAARIGQLEDLLKDAQRAHARAEKEATHRQKFLDLLTPEEHWRLIGRNVGERGVLVVEPGIGDAVLQQLAAVIIDRAARSIEAIGPDHPHVTQRAADACAALVRDLRPAVEEPTLEDAARQLERAAEIARRFKEFFGG